MCEEKVGRCCTTTRVGNIWYLLLLLIHIQNYRDTCQTVILFGILSNKIISLSKPTKFDGKVFVLSMLEPFSN